MKTGYAVLLSALLLSGCAQVNNGLSSLNSGLASLNKGLKTPMQKTDKTVSQICAEASKNPGRANQTFNGLGMTTEGIVSLHDNNYISEDLFLLKVGSNTVSVRGYPDMNSLNNGQRLKIDGTINRITQDFGCMISVTAY
ncbi:hypothetical protein ACVS9Z_003321 [Cronobacter dublinensis]|uniref:hypothetical protein n=1 Tax=Cronobacter dublinensis TaxID=413497 RepID=UPI0024AFBDF5|nr:hypothetical protein [Cronobacter dublinensis]EKM6458066.1 hypothetical protein [Cronobacter dublinensis]EKY3204650.1 hypothetical protein [Cronobacter dublinensis]EKY3225277.1 hypothetical protein [Cronobacter dublinensis]ELQ6159975.1 hypothetical protein [Cronobacter dublinensis]ELY2818248.1 hypothetical protein [Cronobacter dublinensis]